MRVFLSEYEFSIVCAGVLELVRLFFIECGFS